MNESADRFVEVVLGKLQNVGQILAAFWQRDSSFFGVNEWVHVLALDGASDSIPLTASVPAAIDKDIAVVEPTTAGVSQPTSDVDLNVAAIGAFSAASNSCTLAGNPMPLVRPAIGASTADICVFSQSGLDTSMAFSVSGSGDVSVVAKQPAGLGIIHLTLQVTSTAAPGNRTLFIQNTNLDMAAASGVLEVQ